MRRSTGAAIQLDLVPSITGAIVLAGTLLAACSATPANSSQAAAVTPAVTISPAQTTAISGPLAMRAGPASAGTYTTTLFEPTVSLTLASDQWRFFFHDEDDQLALGNGGVGKDAVELTGGRVANVLDPTTHAKIPAPDDLVSWFASHPGLEAESPQPASVGGILGQSIDVMNTGTVNIDIFAYPMGNLRVSAGMTARFWILPYEGPDLVFAGFAGSSRFQEALPTLQQIVDSIVIADG